MHTGSERPDERNFKRALLVSSAFHVLLFVIFAVRAVIYPSDAIRLENSIRVDIVSLPEKKAADTPMLPPPTAPEPATKTEPKPLPAPEPPKPEAPKVNLEKNRRDQAAALKRLEALERMERMQKALARAQAHDPGPARPSSTVVRGNQVSKGNSLTGLQRLEHQGYLASVQQHVKRYWKLPQWMANQNYSARIRIWVDANGTILKKQMIRASGNSEFDERAMAAVEASGILPKPPDDLVNVLSIDGFDADFP